MATPNLLVDTAAPEAFESPVVPDAPTSFSWLDAHPIFVIILVGAEEHPFGIQKDFLCAKSSHYRKHFARQDSEQLENIIKLPEITPAVFGFAQNFMYTGKVFSDADSLPGYDGLIATWKLGDRLGIEGLCDESLEAMKECRRISQSIPATPLLVQVWQDTPEGSSIRKLLLTWAAEYIRSSESRCEFSRSLPQEVLSELVVAMSHLDDETASPALDRKNTHFLDPDEDEGERSGKVPRHRHSDTSSLRAFPERSTARKAAARPVIKVKARKGPGNGENRSFTTQQKLDFCSDLLSRMLSGPGFWTRLVGPFREAVDPVTDGVPDYLQKVSRPMDLSTIRDKMDRGEYRDEEEFLVDMRQIFTNCYTYWKNTDVMWVTCEKFQKTFEEKFAAMPKWLAKMEGSEEPI